jgi:hypothetical protein
MTKHRHSKGDLLESLQKMESAASLVVERWAGGNLADAVKLLDEAHKEAAEIIDRLKGRSNEDHH